MSRARAPLLNEHQLSYVYSQFPTALAISFLCSFILIFIYWKTVSHELLLGWWAALSIISLARLHVLLRYKKNGHVPSRAFQYQTQYLLGVFTSACAWGSSTVFMSISDSVTAQQMHMLMLIGLSAGAMASNSVSFLGYFLFIVPVLSPMFVWMVTHAALEVQLTSIGVVLLAFMLLVISRRFGDHYLSTIRLTKEKDFLVKGLSESNRLLKEEVDVRRRAEQGLIEAKESAEAANRAKTAFLSSMSHELRTPLNSVIGFAQLLDTDEALTVDQREYVQNIFQAGRHLTDLINDVLDLAKIEADSMDIHAERVHLDSVFNDCRRFLSPQADSSDITLDIPSLTDDIFVYADRRRLVQVMLNLLSNAIKYNSRGGYVELSASCDTRHRVVISVKDTGSGFSQEQRDELFHPFSRLGAENSEIEGTGIGLTISKHLVELMGGELSLESTPGKGSIFYVSMPLSKEDATNLTHSPLVLTSPNDATKDIKVLVAEDNKPNQIIIRKMLEKLGYDVDIVENGVEALELWQKKHYNVVLTDCNMPDIDGFELTRRIRQMENTGERCPVIAITADTFSDAAERCFSAGMDAVITKPVEIKKLQQAVAKWLIK